MSLLGLDELGEALRLLLAGDPDTFAAIQLSFGSSCAATVIGTLLGAPLGLAVGTLEFRGRDSLRAVLQSLLAVPTVVIGLVLYLLLSRQGPLGALGLLFTPVALVLGQVVLSTPVIAAHAAAAARSLDRRAAETARALGASTPSLLFTIAGEIRVPLLAAISAAFGRVLSEVGVAMMVGGNIRGHTRTMTTAIALDTARGDHAAALLLGAVLLVAALALNLLATRGRA